MEKLDFVFRKRRDIGLLISDFLDLFKKTFKHFHSTILTLALPFISIFVALIYFALSFGKDFFNNPSNSDIEIIFIYVGFFMLLFMFFFMFIYIFITEYVLKVYKAGNLDFTWKEVLQNCKKYFSKYLKFFLGSILVYLILAIPLILVSFILAFIPFIGGLINQFISTILGVYIIVSFFLYRERNFSLSDSFTQSFNLIKSKLFEYAVASFIFSLMFFIIIGVIILIPSLIIFFISFNSLQDWIDFNSFFDSSLGKIIVLLGSFLMMLMYILFSMYYSLFHSLIYFSAIEENFQEETEDEVDLIGTTKDEF
ncbi:MAG: hypothetical protein H6604_00140 [Flavobacteriales bacterium]|nr:hypothetical protein [Flavobacteriales bacterium]